MTKSMKNIVFEGEGKKCKHPLSKWDKNSIFGLSFTCTIALPYLEGKEEKPTKT